MQQFRSLKVWQRAHALALRVYRLTDGLPATERFGLQMQARRAAVSATSNIAEGSKRARKADYARFLNTASASLAELDSQLLIARDLQFLPVAAVDELSTEIGEISAMLHALRSRVLGRT
jgi:four helix bundle protein